MGLDLTAFTSRPLNSQAALTQRQRDPFGISLRLPGALRIDAAWDWGISFKAETLGEACSLACILLKYPRESKCKQC